MSKNYSSRSETSQNKPKVDWVKVVEVIITILTFGLNHLRKHHKNPSQN